MVLAVGAFVAMSSSSSTGTADAALTVKIKPKGPYKKNQSVRIVAKGYPPNAQMGIGICPAKIRGTGPGDCGSGALGYQSLAVTNANGVARVTLRIPKGKLNSPNRPTAKCNNKKKHRCSVHASTIGGVIVYGKSKVIRYA